MLAPRLEKIASRKRSVAGRVWLPFGALSGMPLALPPVIRIYENLEY